VYLRNTMWKTGKYCQLQCHEPVCCGEGADPCLSLHSRLLSLSRRLLSSFVSRRFDKRKATSTISLAAQTQSVSHVFNKSPFPPLKLRGGPSWVYVASIATTAWEMLPRQVEGSQTLLLFMRRLNPVSIYLPTYRRISAERKGPVFSAFPVMLSILVLRN
jgi:hypothetical protein